MTIEFGTYKVLDQGKMIKDSKRAHIWIVYFKDSRYEIIAKESFVSKKFRFYVQRKLISEFKTKEIQKRKGFDFEYNDMYFTLKKEGNRFKLFVNNHLFKKGSIVEGGDNTHNLNFSRPNKPVQ